MSSTVTQYTVKVPLNPTNFPTTNRNVIWNSTEGKFNLSDSSGSNCTKWTYDSVTTPSGISQYEVRFNNSNLTLATEIYVHKDSLDGSNDWSDYFNKLVRSLCCTLTVRIPTDENDFIIYDFNPSGSSFNGTYLTFLVSDTYAAPLVTDSDFTVSSGDTLCLDFDLFRCEDTGTTYGTGDTENYICRQYWQYETTSLNAVTGATDPDINSFSFAGGTGQFTIGLTGGTTNPYVLSVGDTVYIRMTQTNYWGQDLSALGIIPNNQITFTQYNNNSTQSTGEEIVLTTTDVFNLTNGNGNGYIVFEATIDSLTSGLSSGFPNDTKYCIDVIDLPTPEDPYANCRAVYVHAKFDDDGDNTITTSFVTQLGTTVNPGDDISSFGGAGLGYSNVTATICDDQTYTFVFASTDALGDSQTQFFSDLGTNDVLKYEFVYSNINNDSGDYLLLQVINVIPLLDNSNNVYYQVIVNILPTSNYNSCDGVFKTPRNIVCLTKQTQSAPTPAPYDSEGYVGIVEGTSGSTTISGGTIIDNADITKATRILLSGLDANNNSWVDEFSAYTMSSVRIEYRGSSIEYNVSNTQYSTSGTGKLSIDLSTIIKNGFNSKTAIENNSSEVIKRQSIFLFFKFETISNQAEGRVITSTGSGDGLQAEENLTFINNTLNVTGNTIITGNIYQRSTQISITTNGDHNVLTIPVSSGSSFEYTYFVEEQTTSGFRTGQVLAGIDSSGSVTVYTDTSTPDGTSTTEDISFSTVISGSNLILRATTTNSTTWNVKVRAEIIF